MSEIFVATVMVSIGFLVAYQGCLDLAGGAVDIIADNPPSANLQRTAVSGAAVQAKNA